MSLDILPAPTDKMTTPELVEKLHDYYKGKSGAWAFITQLRNATGWNSVTRTADAMAMGLWPSTGLDLIGFELKVSRSDWLHELKQPEKSEEMKQFCDKWYLVVPTADIVKEGELPEGWGLMVASGRGRTIKVKIEAPKLQPVDVDRGLLASIFRNVTEKCMPLELHTKVLNEQLAMQKRQIDNSNQRALEEAAETAAKIKEFEAATGLTFSDWNRDHLELAKVVKLALEGRYDEGEKKMRQLIEKSENITKYLRGEIEGYRI